jgi:hypothetical protein
VRGAKARTRGKDRRQRNGISLTTDIGNPFRRRRHAFLKVEKGLKK